MTVYSLEWRRYRRSFRQPLRTHHGSWSVREGVILRLQNADGQRGWGEIAPIFWFGSETIGQAIEYCESLKGQVTLDQIAEIPGELPACQFGFESALEIMQVQRINASPRTSLSYSVLLSAEALLEPEKELDERHGFSQNWGARGAVPGVTNSPKEIDSAKSSSEKTFKCKIGVLEIDREIDQIDRLLKVLPQKAKLRLDANGGLSEIEAYRWLEWCDRHAQNRSPDDPKIELIEQPLPPDHPAAGTASHRFAKMQQMSQQFHTPIALDESVARIDQLQDCYEQGWRSIFVIKPAIAGSPARLRQFCHNFQPDVVWSSALETAIGRRYIEDRLIPATALTQRAIGFGVDQLFADDWGQRAAKDIWQSLAGVTR